MLTRREVLSSAALTAAAWICPKMALAKEPFPIVDTHTHFYDPTRPEGVPWPGKSDNALYRRVLPADYKKFAEPLGVTGTVVVEASSWVEDNQWVLDLAAKDPFVLGLVGNLPVGTKDFAGHLQRFQKNAKFLGIRVNSGALKKGLDQPEYLEDLKRLCDAGRELDINGGPELLSLISPLVAKLPELRIVINHVANVEIKGAELNRDWLEGIASAASHPRVFMKVSALVEGASRNGKTAPRDPSFYKPVLDAVWKAFGDDRVIYGSNWPVSERAADYAFVQQLVFAYVSELGRVPSEKFFSLNAKEAYRWPAPEASK